MAEKKESVEATVRKICRMARDRHSAEGVSPHRARGAAGRDQHCRIVPAGGAHFQPPLPPRRDRATLGWSKDFLESGKERPIGDTERQASSRRVSQMRAEVEYLKQPVAAADRFAHPTRRVNELW